MRSAAPGPVAVEFGEYVPLTITWERARAILEPPGCLALRSPDGYLELKFHPVTGMLAEAVLAAAPGMHVREERLAPSAAGDAGHMPFAAPGTGHAGEALGPLAARAYQDCLVVSFGPAPACWSGAGPVLFGVAGDQVLTALCARWTPAERELALASQLPA